MLTQEASADDFKFWLFKAKFMDYAQLTFAIKDCIEAAKAMQGHNPIASNRYMDQAFTFCDARTRKYGNR